MTGWGTAPWRVGLHPPGAVPPPARCDVVVVGAGLTGLSAAWHLATRGRSVAVLEADRVGAGASGHTGALVLEGTAQGPRPQADRCLETVAEVARAIDARCDLDLPGCDLLVHRDEPGELPARWRDGGRHLCVSGVEPGGTMDVGAMLAALGRAALAAGATIHEQTPVTAVDAGRVTSACGDVEAAAVVVAVNAWTATLLGLPRPFGVALTLALATVAVDRAVRDAIGLGHGRPFYTLDLPYLWGRLLADGRVIFGSGLVWARDGRPESVDLRHPEVEAAFARLEARVHGLHPALAGVPVDARWGGPIAFPDRRPPLLGRHPALPGVYVAGGYAGHGVALSVHAGRVLAAAILDEAPLPRWGAFDDAGRPSPG